VPRAPGPIGVLVPEAFLVAGGLGNSYPLPSASSSSATIMGMPVLTPWPISDRWQTMVTVPSSSLETNASGSSTHPSGMSSAPYFLCLLGLCNFRRELKPGGDCPRIRTRG